jgi:hypothetical protein
MYIFKIDMPYSCTISYHKGFCLPGIVTRLNEEEEERRFLDQIDAIARNEVQPIEIRAEANGDVTHIYQQAYL